MMISEIIYLLKLFRFFQLLMYLMQTRKWSVRIWFEHVPKPVLKFFSSTIPSFINRITLVLGLILVTVLNIFAFYDIMQICKYFKDFYSNLTKGR